MATAQEWRERGNAFHTRKEHARAVECYTSAIALDPSSAALRTNRAAAHHASRDFAAALDDARASIALDPSWAKGHYRAGAALAAMDRHDEAALAFRAGTPPSEYFFCFRCFPILDAIAPEGVRPRADA